MMCRDCVNRFAYENLLIAVVPLVEICGSCWQYTSDSVVFGSHFPLCVHVDVLVPVSVNPEGQKKVTAVPPIAGSLYSGIIMESSATDGSRGWHLAVREQNIIIYYSMIAM